MLVLWVVQGWLPPDQLSAYGPAGSWPASMLLELQIQGGWRQRQSCLLFNSGLGLRVQLRLGGRRHSESVENPAGRDFRRVQFQAAV